MDVLRISPSQNNRQIIRQIANVLEAGGVIAHPTETVYGLAANIYNEDAVRKIYNIKRRSEAKALSVMVRDIAQIEVLVGEISPFAMAFMKKVFPNSVTVILPIRKKLDLPYFDDRDSIGFRIPKHEFSLQLLNEIDFPITTTSANKSGFADPQLAMEVMNYFGSSLDLLVDGGRTPIGKPSTIVDLSNDTINILREGSFDVNSVEL